MRQRRSVYSVAAAVIGFAQLMVVVAAFTFSTWDGNRVIDDPDTPWMLGGVITAGVVAAVLVARGTLIAIAMLAIAELWVISVGFRITGVLWWFRALVLGSGAVAIAMCALAARRSLRVAPSVRS